MSADLFYEFWLTLSDKQREERIQRTYTVCRAVAQKQLDKIKKLEHVNIKKRGAHFWVFQMIKGFWQDTDFFTRLGKRRDKHCGVPILRIILEKLIRVGYFCKKTPNEQEIITEKEIMKMYMRFYNEDKVHGNDGADYKKYYDEANTSGFPPIESVTERDLNPFPNSLEKMLYESEMPEPDKWYTHYRFLSEAEHGGMFYQYFRSNQPGEYRRALMLLLPICYKMLEWTDIYLGFNMENDVREVIKKGESINKKGMQGFMGV